MKTWQDADLEDLTEDLIGGADMAQTLAAGVFLALTVGTVLTLVLRSLLAQ